MFEYYERAQLLSLKWNEFYSPSFAMHARKNPSPPHAKYYHIVYSDSQLFLASYPLKFNHGALSSEGVKLLCNSQEKVYLATPCWGHDRKVGKHCHEETLL